ncbi:MAG: hypothetical protein WBM17_15440 [Anaerolineales bacterium]
MDLAAAYASDVTGDTTNEIIVTLVQTESKIQSMGGYPLSSMLVFIVGCVDNQFHMLFQNKLADVVNAPRSPSGVLRIEDLNADGLREIVFAYLMDRGLYDDYWQAEMLEWNGSSFRALLPAAQENPIPGYPSGPASPIATNADPEFRDVDGNGTIEILFPDRPLHHHCDDGPWRVTKSIYMWDGEFYRYMWTDPGSPNYRFEAAFDGDYFTLAGLYDKAEASYLRAVHDKNLPAFDYSQWSEKALNVGCWGDYSDPDEPYRIVAYARLRLLELFAFLDRQNDAKADWEYLRTHYSEKTAGYVYAALAKTFWDSYSAGGDIKSACAAVRDQSEANQNDIFGPMGPYGYNSLYLTPKTICPFPSVAD